MYKNNCTHPEQERHYKYRGDSIGLCLLCNNVVEVK